MSIYCNSKSEVMKEFFYQLKFHKKMSLQALADAIVVPVSRIEKYHNGRLYPNVRELDRMLIAAKINVFVLTNIKD